MNVRADYNLSNSNGVRLWGGRKLPCLYRGVRISFFSYSRCRRFLFGPDGRGRILDRLILWCCCDVLFFFRFPGKLGLESDTRGIRLFGRNSIGGGGRFLDTDIRWARFIFGSHRYRILPESSQTDSYDYEKKDRHPENGDLPKGFGDLFLSLVGSNDPSYRF